MKTNWRSLTTFLSNTKVPNSSFGEWNSSLKVMPLSHYGGNNYITPEVWTHFNQTKYP